MPVFDTAKFKTVSVTRGLRALGASLGLLGGLLLAAHADPASGVYRITPRSQPGQCLDVWNWGNTDETSVDMWTWGGNATPQANQQWLVEAQSDGTYKIYAYSGRNSLQMLDLTNGSTAPGNYVNTYEDNGNTTQRWYLQDTGGGWYRFIPANAGQDGAVTLEVRGGTGAAAGARTDINTYTGADNQVFRLDWAGPQATLPNPKKGLGGRETKVPYVNGTWEYNWGGGEPADEPTGVEFVPMAWGYYGGNDPTWLQGAASQPGVKNILAFNEPDHTDQANLTVSYAEQGFLLFNDVPAGVSVGGPACGDDMDAWGNSFFGDVTANNSVTGTGTQQYRMNFIPIHCYLNTASSFENYVTAMHNRYPQYPLWITEFAPTTWGNPEGITAAQAAAFMRAVLPWLNSQSYVARYSWYTGASPGTGILGTSALVNTDGTLTDLGKLYARM